MIWALITMLCGVGCLVCILRQQHYIQLQDEEIQRYREALSLTEKALTLYKKISDKQAEQIKFLRIYAAIPQHETDCEK